MERWVDVITRAHAERRPAALSVVVPQQNGLAFNRRFLMKDGSVGWNPGRGNPDILRPAGPTDPDLPFVLVRDADSNEPMGGLTVFAMHTAIYGGAPLGTCYPGQLEKSLRDQFAAPGFVSVFAQGCAGDVNHIDVSASDDPDGEIYPAVVGARLAGTITAALPYARAVRPASLAMRSMTFRVPVTPITEKEYAEAENLMETMDRNGAPFLTQVDAWRKTFRRRFWDQYQGQYPQEVQAIRLDADTAIVTLPHEVFVELGMAIKAASPFRTTMILSLANDLDFYIPTQRAFEEGNYEPTTCPLEPGCGERLVGAAVGLLNELK